MSKALRVLSLVVLACAGSSGCASVDFDYPKEASHARSDTDDTGLGRLVAGVDRGAPGESGFYLLSDGIQALAARLVLARKAERTLDVQYYLIAKDFTGYLLIDQLMKAADRGVRVRVLLDDIQTQGYDRGMWGMDAHPNIEVRIFNPFTARTWRTLRSAMDLGRVNRRMHNKSFTADNQVTIIGGRNIGAEYFAARHDVNFGDLDTLCFGPVVPEVSDMFDLYWNDRAAVPVPAIVDEPDDPEGEQVAFRQRIAKALEGVESTDYGRALDQSILEATTNDDESDGSLTWTSYQLVYDPPSKAHVKRDKDQETILTPLRQAVASARDEFVLISPYFVPRRSGVEAIGELVDRGIRVRVLTNSLAANNHSVVHSGYAPSRKPLLRMGVELWEVRSDAYMPAVRRAKIDTARATLHTKAFILDRNRVFVGSFNFDPRSAYINTEMGIILDSPELAARLAESLDRNLPNSAFRLRLNDQGRLRWIGWEEGEPVEYATEPHTGFWKRLGVSFMRLFPIKGLL